MSKNDFDKNVIKVIHDRAAAKDPEKLANALYFYIKQYPEELKADRKWVRILKNVKILLSERYFWSMKQIHRFFIVLSSLTKYMKKST